MYLCLLITTWKTDWFTTEFANNLETSFTLTFTLLLYGYNNWNWLFILFRKGWMNAFPDTVAWTGTYKFFLESEEFSKTNKEFYIKLKDSEGLEEFKEKKDRLDIKIDGDGGEKNIQIIATEFPEYQQISFKYKVSKGYRDSKKEISYFKNYLETYIKCASRGKTVGDVQGSEGKKAIYSVNVKMQKSNPFYGPMVKRLDGQEQKTFKLTFSNNEGLSAEVRPKLIILKSEKLEVIESALSEYIALGSII